MIEVRITKANDGQKIEKFVRHFLSDAPLGFIYKAFRKKDIKINGHWVKKEAVVKEGDVVRIYVTDGQLEDFKKPREVEAHPLPHPVAYEDENVLIVEKPRGLLVIGDENEKRATLARQVLDYLYYTKDYDPNGSFTPSPAHRLDRNTGGFVIFGKRDESLKELERLFKERAGIRKKYLALVVGHLEGEGAIDLPLRKDESKGFVEVASIKDGGKEAKTLYKVMGHYGDFTLVEVELLTGRTHQIRVHFKAIGHPLAGDQKYGDFQINRWLKSSLGWEHQFLRAYALAFEGISGPLDYLNGRSFKMSLDNKELSLLNALKSVSV